MPNRSLCILLAVLVSPSLAAAQALPEAEIARYRGPVDAADAIGGYRSDRLLLKLAPSSSLRRSDRGWSVTGGVAVERAALVDALSASAATAVRPAFPVAPADAALVARHGLDRWLVVEFPIGSDVTALAAELARYPSLVERAERDGIGGILDLVPNDPSFGLQWAARNTGQVVGGVAGIPGADIDLPGAWALHTGGAEITIAVIDTGVSFSHPDLTPKLVPGWSTLSGTANADDSFLISHGTHCAGIAAAATNNAIGVAGVSWGARIMPVKVLTFIGSGTESDVAAGVVWSVDNGAHIGSMSLGFPGSSAIVEDAVNYATDAGMLVVAATGNTAGAPIAAPAKYPAVLAVGATDNRDLIASFTSTGPEMDVTAPGVDIYSTWDVFFQPNTYTYQSGTSMACPQVAGLAALLWSIDPSRTNAEIRALIESTAEDKGAPGWDPIFGHGRVNARLAVEAALAPRCAAADLDCDGAVGPSDLALLLGAWGSAGPLGDLDGDGVVGSSDLALLLGAWSGN